MSRYRFISLGVLLGLGAVASAGCGDDDHYIVVTVGARPAIHDPVALTVTLSNAGTSRMDTLSLPAPEFPTTFSISTPGRTGELGIRIDAVDAGGLVVGSNSVTTTVDASTVAIDLESVDFVVNTELTGDQFTTDDFESSGFQLAALPDGTWTEVFRDGCQQDGCRIYARRFDATGVPVDSALAAGTSAFVLSTENTDGRSTAAVASSIAATVTSPATTTIAVWDFGAQDGTLGIACRALDAAGAAASAQTRIAVEDADVVSIAALADGNFAAVWTAFPGENIPSVIHASIIKPDCTGTAPQTLSDVAKDAGRAAVTSSGDRVLYSWISEGQVHVRTAMLSGQPITADTVLIAKAGDDEVAQARIAPAPDGGFVLAARWDPMGDGPGRIDLLRLGADGVATGPATLVTDRSANDDNPESFGIATRGDGTVFVVWASCEAFSDGSRCGTFGRFHRDTGEPIADSFTVPTSITGDQVRPSVVALPDAFVATWTDLSASAPDTSGVAARARIVYSP